jgi:predicted DNA binding protein/GAF domain-containing protein
VDCLVRDVSAASVEGRVAAVGTTRDIDDAVRRVQVPAGEGSDRPTGADAHSTGGAPALRADGGRTSPEVASSHLDRPLERITDGFLTLDESWTVTYLNGAGRELLGDAATDVVGRCLWEAFPDSTGTGFEAGCRRAMETQETQRFESPAEAIGTRLEVRAYPSSDGLSVLFREITERTRGDEGLGEGEGALERLHTLAADGTLSRQEKIREMLMVGRDRLGVDVGFLTRIEDGTLRIEEGVGDHPVAEAGVTMPLSEAYCRHTIGSTEPFAVNDASDGMANDPAFETTGLACYLGAAIEVDGEQYGTVCFGDTEPRERGFTESETTFIDLLTDWVSYLLEQRKYASERAAHQQRLSGILDTTQSLMQARDRDEVAEIVANAARDVLDFDINAVRLYDAEAGTLVPSAQTTATTELLGDRPVYDVGEGLPGEVFATGQSRVVDDVAEVGIDPSGDGVMSAMYYPMGVHGTITVGATERAAFDDTDEQVLALLATAAAAASTRAKREREVREAREHVERVLERINGLIENTIEVLVQATTREELEADVVDVLATANPYTFAWIGTPDVTSETLSPSAQSGDAPVSVTDLSFDLTGDGAVAAAYRDGTPQVVQQIDGHADLAGDAEGIEAGIIVPLVYTDTTYGVVAVFAGEADAFDEREQVVLGALGRAVANAINAVERGRILDADRVIELEFSVDDSGLLFSRLSRAARCTLRSAGTDYRTDGTLQIYLTAEGVDGEELAGLAREDESVREATLIVDHDEECLIEIVVEESLIGLVTEHGAVPRDVTAENGVARFTVELPYEAEARDLFDLVKSRYPNTSLVGYHEHERPVETRQEFRAALADRFTDRQETALRTAFLGGFFEWPRGIDGNELAETMDISRPTYHQHLRAAQQKVLEELFDPQT